MACPAQQAFVAAHSMPFSHSASSTKTPSCRESQKEKELLEKKLERTEKARAQEVHTLVKCSADAAATAAFLLQNALPAPKSQGCYFIHQQRHPSRLVAA